MDYRFIFKKLLSDKGQNNSVSKYFVVCFDKTLNENLQKKQLDLYLRFWDGDKVLTRYIHSEFLGKAQSVDILECFETLDQMQSLKHMVQVSMDGPKVNLKFQKQLEKRSRDMYEHGLLNLGSCGIHQLHNALKAAMEAMNIGEFLKCLFKLFHDAPARRQEYTTLTNCKVFPQSFAVHRWADNQKAAARALEIISPVEEFCKAVDTKDKRVTKIDTYSYRVVRDFVVDQFADVKLLFFIDMCDLIEEFLVKFQADKPMAPFLVNEIYNILRDIMQRFLVSTYCDKHDSDPMLARIRTAKFYVDSKKIDLGWRANAIRDSHLQAGRTGVLTVSEQCREAMIIFFEKIKTTSPANHPLAKNMDCLDPALIAGDIRVAKQQFQNITICLKEANLSSDGELDLAYKQFKKFVKEHKDKDEFKNFVFDKKEHRVDTLFYNALCSKNEYMDLWKVVRILLVVSHGQASVERGFSINKYASTANQSEESLVARRVVRDHIKYIGEFSDFSVTNELIADMRAASKKYKAHLEDE